MTALAIVAAALGATMTAWFAVALVRRDNSLADVAWGGGFILVAWLSLALAVEVTPRGVLTAILVTVWGVRLAAHIIVRNRGRGEDFRYAAWRAKWGRAWVWRSYLQVFLLQGMILFVASTPILVATLRPGRGLGLLDAAGVVVWLAGFVIESVADWQLHRFRRRSTTPGATMDRGLWSWSRHPNYFGESCLWWGLGLIASAAPGGWIGLVGPALITFLLLRVSGVPMLEAGLLARQPGYADYVRRTSAFLPLPPRH